MRLIKAGATDQSVMIRFMDATDGSPETGVTAATAGLAVTYRVTSHAAVTLNSGSTPAVNDLANLTTAHTDAGIKHIADGWYRFDLPDDAVHEGVTCLVTATATGMIGFGTVLQLVPFDPQVAYLAVNMQQIIGTTLTETSAGYLTAGFKKLFDVATPVLTAASVNQTGDSYAIVNSGTYGNSALLTAISASAPTATTATAGTATPTVTAGTYADTATQNSTYWQVTASAAAVVTATLTYACGTGKLANTVRIIGRYQVAAPTTNKYVSVQAYNYVTATWDTISSTATRINGQTGTTDNTYTYALTVQHMSVAGAAQIRFVGSDQTATSSLYLDYVPYLYQTSGTSADAVAQAVYQKMRNVVYSDGVWIDTVNGVAGAVVGDNGTSWNPVSNYADALTIAAALGVKRFYLKPGSTITLNQNHTGWRFVGYGNIALNGQTIEDCVFENCYEITGTGVGDDMHFSGCGLGDLTLDHFYAESCMVKGTITLTAAGGEKQYYLHDCSDAVSGGTATFSFGAAANELYLRNWRGGVQLLSMASGESAFVDGAGRVLIGATCAAGSTITVRGQFTITDSVVGGYLGTLTDSARWAEDQSVASVTGSVSQTGDSYAIVNSGVYGNSEIMTGLNSLNDISASAVDTQLSSTHGSGAWGASTGASSKTYTVTVGGAPAAGVYCRMTTDSAGTNNVDAGTTNAAGQVVFHHDLSAGATVYVWRTKAGVAFTDPDTETI